MAIIQEPFSKVDNVENGLDLGEGKREVPEYTHHQLYLGTYLHQDLNKALVDDPTDFKSGMEGYLSHLRVLGCGTELSVKSSIATMEIADELEKLVPEGYSKPIYLSEMAFMPSLSQVEVIARSIEDEDLSAYVKGLGYKDLDNYVYDALLQKGKIRIGDHDEISWETYAVSREAEIESIPHKLRNQVKVCKLLNAISSYYYLDLETPRPNSVIDLSEIKETMRVSALSASAKPDFISFMPSETLTEEERQVITDFTKIAKGSFFGARPMHAIGSFSEPEVETTLNLLSMIMQDPPKVALRIGEIKTHVQTHRKVASQNNENIYLPVTFNPNEVPDYRYTDMAHTEFALYQFFARMMNYKELDSEKFGGFNPKALLDITRASQIYKEDKEKYNHGRSSIMPRYSQNIERERLKELYENFEYVKDLIRPPHQSVLVRMSYPVYDPRPTQDQELLDHEGLLVEEMKKPIRYNVDILDPRRLIQKTEKVAENFIRRKIRLDKNQTPVSVTDTILRPEPELSPEDL